MMIARKKASEVDLVRENIRFLFSSSHDFQNIIGPEIKKLHWDHHTFVGWTSCNGEA